MATMAEWTNPDRWSALCSGAGCPICQRGEPLDIVATLSVSWVTMHVAPPVRGYVCLVSKIHAVELHDLAEDTAAAFMQDARRVSKSLSYVTGAVKINYEIHGNSIPHLHMHFFPRYRGDQFEGAPINPKQAVQPVYLPSEFDQIRRDFLEALLPSLPHPIT
jgi:diadenosine tetraphosphate (Ap4A) HIT family hydrolase